jgi:hypothetical protein
MVVSSVRHERLGPLVSKASTRPTTPEEEQFVRSFAHALIHATALAAADPETPLPAESLAERVRLTYEGFRPNQHVLIRERARARLSAPREERRRDFGDHADWTPETAEAMDDNLRALLRSAVHARVEAQRAQIEEFLSANGVASSLEAMAPPKTWLEAGYFTGDVVANWTKMTISSPIKLQFQWRTEEPEAERGLWQLRYPLFNAEPLIAAGDAGDAPGPDVFELDLGKYIPSKPPSVPTTFHVRVSPQTKPKMLPGSAQGQAGKKVFGHAVGPPSNPVEITYSAIVDPMPSFQVYEIYRSLQIGPRKIHMVEDQVGPGAEEFWIMGFVQEFLPSGSPNPGKQVKFGPLYRVLDPDGPRWADISVPADFWLSNPPPDNPDWPRAYTIVVSVLEQDDGGAFNDWHSDLGHIANEFLSGNVASDVRQYLEDQFKEFIKDNWEEVLQQAPAVAQYIASLVSSSVAAVVAEVLLAAAFVISGIISGASDDFYGIQYDTIALLTNAQGYIGLPGQATNQLPEGFRIETDPITLLGSSSWPEATKYDGIVEIYYDAILWGLETY